MFFQRQISISESNDKTRKDDADSLRKLNLLQIQFDDMMQVSSHLLKEQTSLAAKNAELINVVSVLQQEAKEDADIRALLRKEIRDLKKKLESTQAGLEEALTARNLLFEQLQNSRDEKHESNDKMSIGSETKSNSKKNLMQQHVALSHGESFKIDGVSKRNRFKNLNGVLTESMLNDRNWRFVTEKKSEKIILVDPENFEQDQLHTDEKELRVNQKRHESAKAA